MNKAIWLARLLHSHGGMSKRDILDAWRDQDEKSRPMPESTFYDNRRILESTFDLKVDCRAGIYSLSENACDMLPATILNGDQEPDEQESNVNLWVPLISEAVGERRKLRMEYAPINKSAYTTDLSPYCLHRYEEIWYVVGYSTHHSSIRNFASDRITTLTALPSHFRLPAGFSRKQWFANSVGAYGGPGIKAEHVVIEPRSSYVQAYIKSRPLHPSQKFTETSGHAPRFELDVAPTRDFIGRLLSFGSQIRVVEPLSLKLAIKKEAEAICQET